MAATHGQVRGKPDLPSHIAILGTRNEIPKIFGKYHKIFGFGSYLYCYFIHTVILLFRYLQTVCMADYTNHSASQKSGTMPIKKKTTTTAV